MSIQFDAKTQGSAGASPSSQTYSHTCSGVNRILYVSIFSVRAGGADSVSGVTYGGVSMTRVDYQPNSLAGNDAAAYLYRLVNPASGANNVVISYTSSSYAVSVACSYTGAKQSGGVFVSGKNTNTTSSSISITPNSANNWIAMATGADNTAPTATGASFLRQVGSNVAITAFDTNGGVTGATTMGASSDQDLYSVAESFEPELNAINFDSSAFVAGTSGSSASWSHTCSGEDRILFVAVFVNANDGIISSVTYNGVAMTSIGFSQWPGSSVSSSALYYLINPATGTNTVAVTLGSSVGFQGGQSVSYTGAKQTGQPDSSNTYSATGTTTPSMSTTVVATGCWLVGQLTSSGNDAFTPAGSNVVRVNRFTADNSAVLDSNGTVSTGSQTLGGSVGASRNWRGVIASFAPTAAAAGPANVKTFDGVTQSTGVKTYYGVALASVKSVNGVT